MRPAMSGLADATLRSGKTSRSKERSDMMITVDLKTFEEMSDKIIDMEDTIRELFALLDITEQTDDGRTFHPNTIRSCRALDAEKLEQVLSKLKRLS
jgi:hypothetical protein